MAELRIPSQQRSDVLTLSHIWKLLPTHPFPHVTRDVETWQKIGATTIDNHLSNRIKQILYSSSILRFDALRSTEVFQSYLKKLYYILIPPRYQRSRDLGKLWINSSALKLPFLTKYHNAISQATPSSLHHHQRHRNTLQVVTPTVRHHL